MVRVRVPLVAMLVLTVGVAAPGSAAASDLTVAKLLAPAGMTGDAFGSSVAVTDGLVVVGAPRADVTDRDDGAVHVFRPDASGTWTSSKVTASDGARDDVFGWSVAVWDDLVVVGAPQDDDRGTNAGAVYVLEPDGAGGWSETKLTAPDGASGDLFGTSVAAAGGRIVVGAYLDDDGASNSGSAYVFERDGTGDWTAAKLTASDPTSDDAFGYAVAASDDRVVVGAYRDDDAGSSSGSAYVYEPDGTGGWAETKLVAADAAGSDFFGYSVAASGDRVVVGAYGNDDAGSQSGSAYVFTAGAAGWTQTKLAASDGAFGDSFGWSVAAAGDRVVVGTPQDDDTALSSGSAYLFEADGSGWAETKLVAPDPEFGDLLGSAVAVSARNAVAGAYAEDERGAQAGAAYLFASEVEADTTPPVLTVPDTIVVEATDASGAVVEYVVSAEDDIDPDPVVTCDPASGSLFPVGTSTVHCSATDATGNRSEASFDVTVTRPAMTFGRFLDEVAAMDLPRGTTTSLLRKIESAEERFLAGDLRASGNILRALLHHVDALEGKKLTTAQAERIRAAVGELLG